MAKTRKAEKTAAGESATWRRMFARSLLRWFGRHARDLPWRRTRNLYAIWVSEIMLQQTQVATVVPYFNRFLNHFPSVTDLAAADEQEVLKLWEGLGYYRRARQLHAAAKQIVAIHGGRFPNSFDDVWALPGIGRYTAGAILSIGLDRRLPILEANTIRVLSRLAAFRGDPSSSAGQKQLWSTAEAILPRRNCGAFNQALMELGSEICTPREPKCEACPVIQLCAAHQRKLISRIPQTAKPKSYEDKTEFAVVIRRGKMVLLRQCEPGERWAGLWDFPRFGVRGTGMTPTAPEIVAATHDLVGLSIASPRHLTTLKHGVTRFRITLHCYEATAVANGRPANKKGVRWVYIDSLAEYPLNTTGRKISRLLAQREVTQQKCRVWAAQPANSQHKSC